MTKKNITITALAAVMILSMASFAMAYGHGGGKGNGRGYHNQNNYYNQLTPEKQEAVDAIYEKYRPKFDELRTEMLTKHSTLQAMVNGGDADEKKIGKLTADMAKLRDKMIDTRDSMFTELEKETGIVNFNGRGNCGFGQGCDRGMGRGMGRGAGCPGLGQGRI